jgi:outer membrane protein assembly factor BamE (lipoprotein component of BamABCDE complex)
MNNFLLTIVITGLIYTLPMNFKPVFANRITEANYDNLKIGMTYQEVKEILGREGEIYTEYNSPTLENFGVAYRWLNNDGTGIVAAFDYQNKLIQLTAQNLNTNNFGINREPPVVTSLNVENIKVGMTYDEVRTIIGNGGTKQPTRDNYLTNPNTTKYIWLNPDDTSMTIIFDSNQKVVTIRTQNMNTYNFGNPFWNQPLPVYSITGEKYEKLQLGMTYQEIRNILKEEGELDTEFDPEAFEKSRAATEMQVNTTAYRQSLFAQEQQNETKEEDKIKDAYKWMNPDKTGIKVVFNIQDKAVAIYTFGLGVGLE